MSADLPDSASETLLRRVYASVTLESPTMRDEARAWQRENEAEGCSPVSVEQRWLLGDDDEYDQHLHLVVRLAAEDGSGQRIDGGVFGIGGPRKRDAWWGYVGPPPPARPLPIRLLQELGWAISARRYRVNQGDIERAVDGMLGRDPRLHRPPRLSWHGLVDALDEAGIEVSEEQLIGLPLTLELDDEVRAQLAS